MIRRIQIDNFKSLDGFSLPPVGSPPLANFTCLIGANGSGKTTVLQAIDFLSQLVKGRVPEWLKERNWSLNELFSQLDGAGGENITITAEIKMGSTPPIQWACKYHRNYSSIIEELISEDGRCLLHANPDIVTFLNDRKEERNNYGLEFFGSALSILADKDIHPSLRLLKQSFGKYVANFELVSTFNLKQDSYPSREIGPQGENLSGFIHEISEGVRERVYTRMREFFPSGRAIQREVGQNNLVKLSLFEKNMRMLLADGSALSNGISSRHFSDGFARILAIVAQIESSALPEAVNAQDRVLLLDEIENGVHPETMAKLVAYLAKAPVQVIATTHSPLILNDLTDAQAEESVILLYRNSEGRARSCRYFDLPSAKKKLGILGPGEVYVDTSIEQLAREAEDMEWGTSAQARASTL